MTDLNAAERPHMLDACCCVRCEDCRREFDPTPIDEAFARKVSSRVTTGGRYFTGPDVEGSFSIRLVGDDVIFRIDRFNAATFTNPTIGDFYTACRLFRVQLKEGV